MANVEFGTGKTVVILTIVAGCFTVLWPKILYPLFMGQQSKHLDSNHLDGCCDVIFETDINAIKIMNDLCGSILNRRTDFDPKLSQAYQQGKLSKEVINTCRTEVMNMCGIDIAVFLNKKDKIGHSYKQMLDEIRSFNISICLRHHFGVNPGLLGAPRRMRIWSSSTPRYLRQERPLRFRPEMVHPALREKGRTIPHSHVVPKVLDEKDRSRAVPVPGMRPPLGGPGHVVPPPKSAGIMGVIMPIYTAGIIVFFTYTIMKIFSRKTRGGDDYKSYTSDPEFRRMVFSEDYSNGCAAGIKEDKLRGKEKLGTPVLRRPQNDHSTRLGWNERDTRDAEIDHLKKRLAETEKVMERIVAQMETFSTELQTEPQLVLSCTPLKVRDPVCWLNACSMYLLRCCECPCLRNSFSNSTSPIENGTEALVSTLKKSLIKSHVSFIWFCFYFLVISAITGLLAEVDQQLDKHGETQNQYNTELKGKQTLEEFSNDEISTEKTAPYLSAQVDTMRREAKNGHMNAYQDSQNDLEKDAKPKVKVVGLELVAECEGGQKWSRPATPNLGVGGSSRSATPIPLSCNPEPQNIFLEGALPQQSQLLVTDSKTQTLTVPGDEPEPPVILSSKMTLSLISVDAALPDESIRRDQPPSSQLDLRSECDDLGTTDSTLLDVDSVLIDESEENEYEEYMATKEQKGGAPTVCEVNKITEEKPSNYATATVSGRTEAGLNPEMEGTAVDVSNLDGLDLTEEQEELQSENARLCNGNLKEETEEPQEPKPSDGGDLENREE